MKSEVPNSHAWTYFAKSSLCIFTIGIAVAVCAGPRSQSESISHDASQDGSFRARIRRIESGLLPAITIKGQPLRKMDLFDRMQHYHVPGVSIAFFDHGDIAWTKTYGYADVAQHVPVTEETRFQACSISKPTTALAAMRLVDQGKLDLDEDVNRRLKEWQVPENEFTRREKVTLRRLLSHTAGINRHSVSSYPEDSPIPSLLQVLKGERPATTVPTSVILEPGTAWRYSGGGYSIVQLLLTETENESFPQLMQDLVLRPAGMTHSAFERPVPQSKWWRLSAKPYRGDGTVLPEGIRVYPELAGAGLWTTPSDLAHMAMEVAKEYQGLSDSILSEKAAHLMLTPQIDHWGLGFSVVQTEDRLLFGHGGDDQGFAARLYAYLPSGQGVAIMSNGTGGDSLLSELMCAVAAEYGWPNFHPREHELTKVPFSQLKAYAGRYQLADGQIIRISVVGGHAFIKGFDLAEQIFPESETNFFILSDETTFEFQKSGNALTVHDGGDLLVARKVSDR
jgi:CubicO group peptidase (beta-lactamase class C family)